PHVNGKVTGPTSIIRRQLWNVRGRPETKSPAILGVCGTTIERPRPSSRLPRRDPEECGYWLTRWTGSGKVAGAYRRLIVRKQAKDLDSAALEFPTRCRRPTMAVRRRQFLALPDDAN